MSFYIDDEGHPIFRAKTRRRAGRPALPPGQRKLATSISLKHDDLLYALKLAEASHFTGNLSAGIGIALDRCREQEALALAAIKAAAERRDQEAVKATGGCDEPRSDFDD